MNDKAHDAPPVGGEFQARAEVSALTVMTRAEIDTQISTAHQYPRSLAKFQKRALEMVSLDEDTAESCIYSRPIGKEGGEVKYAEGMSIRMAEIVAACYGNIRVGATLLEQTERYVKARGYAHDLESNTASTSEVIESTVDKYGKPYTERMRIVVAKAALSKARRDATFSVVPRALCKAIETQARQVAIGDATTLEKRRTAVMDWVKKLGIPVDRVFAALEVKGEADIGLDALATLTGLKTAIKDGEVTIDEAFPKVATEGGSTAGTAGLKAALGASGAPAGASGAAGPAAAAKAAPKGKAKPAAEPAAAPAGKPDPEFLRQMDEAPEPTRAPGEDDL